MKPSPSLRSRLPAAHYGWVVVAVGALATCIGFGALFSLPVFLQPIAADTGWSRAGISAAMTLDFIVLGVSSFAWGALTDRIGPQRVLLAGGVLLGAGIVCASQASALWQFQLAYGVLVGAAGGTFMAPTITTVSLWFDKDRALAVSLVTVGVGVAPMTISPLAAWLIGVLGWRDAQLALGLAAAALVIPASFLVRRPPHAPLVQAGAAQAALGAQSREALGSRAFALLGTTFFLCCATHSGPIFHTVSYAIGCGIAPMAAVAIYSVEGVAGLGGRVLLGLLADRLGVKLVIVAGLLVQAVAAGAYALASSLGEFYAVATIFGLAYGGVMPLYAVLVRAVFPPQIMGTVLGALTMLSSLGMALGPSFGGWVYDRAGTYVWLYVASLAVGAAAVAVALALPAGGREPAPGPMPA